MISLELPWALLALPLPWFVWRFFPPHRERVPALRFPFFRRIVSVTGAEPRPGAVVVARSRLQMGAGLVIWGLLIVAIAQPERLGAPVEITRAARDVVLAIDLSGSMDVVDFPGPDGTPLQRLDAVKRVVREFVSRREGDRLALIIFGTRAFLQSPLTEDLAAIADLVDQSAVGMAGPHTAIGDAIGLAIRTFEASEVKQRLLILLSDGADTGSQMSPVNAAEIARGKGIEIHTIGVGDPRGKGENRVDTATLQDIAARTGGRFFFASDLDGLAQIYQRIDELTPRVVDVLSHRSHTSLAYIPLTLAALLGTLVLAWLSRGRLGRASG